MLDLRPCPFCGGEAEVIHIEEGENAGGSCVCCKQCMASSNVEFEFKENFVSNWNSRMQPPAGETIRATQDGSMEATSATGQSSVDAASTPTESWEEQFYAATAALSEYADFYERHSDHFDAAGNYLPNSQMDGDLRESRARIEQLQAALKHVRSFFDSDGHEYADELAFIDAALKGAALLPVWQTRGEIIEECAKVAEAEAETVAGINADRYWQSRRIMGAIRALASPQEKE